VKRRERPGNGIDRRAGTKVPRMEPAVEIAKSDPAGPAQLAEVPRGELEEERRHHAEEERGGGDEKGHCGKEPRNVETAAFSRAFRAKRRSGFETSGRKDDEGAGQKERSPTVGAGARRSASRPPRT
jgi:hypothetical protein